MSRGPQKFNSTIQFKVADDDFVAIVNKAYLKYNGRRGYLAEYMRDLIDKHLRGKEE